MDDADLEAAGAGWAASAAGRAPEPGNGSQDPDDVNGAGYRDHVVPVPGEDRFAVLHGSAKGLDPSARRVYGRDDLGLDDPPDDAGTGQGFASDTLADLDDDGFPDFVTTVEDEGELAADALTRPAGRVPPPCCSTRPTTVSSPAISSTRPVVVDGEDELILNWAPGQLFGVYGENPTHWWITDGTGSEDGAAFAATGLAAGGS